MRLVIKISSLLMCFQAYAQTENKEKKQIMSTPRIIAHDHLTFNKFDNDVNHLVKSSSDDNFVQGKSNYFVKKRKTSKKLKFKFKKQKHRVVVR